MLSDNLKKLTYRLQYRGIKELDIFFKKVALKLSKLSQEDLNLLEKLTNEQEDKIYSWVLGYEDKPNVYKKIIEKLLT